MGLFDGKAKKEAAEKEVLQKLSQVEMLASLVDLAIENGEEEPWLLMGQSYYDSCKRIVTVIPEGFEIKWHSYHDEPYIGQDGRQYSKKVEDIHGSDGYSFTKSGYVPRHSDAYDDGSKEIPENRICCLCAAVIREHMMKKMPTCRFGEVREDASFTYAVPSLSFDDWF